MRGGERQTVSVMKDLEGVLGAERGTRLVAVPLFDNKLRGFEVVVDQVPHGLLDPIRRDENSPCRSNDFVL